MVGPISCDITCEAASSGEILYYCFIMKQKSLNDWGSEDGGPFLVAREIQGGLVHICQLCISLLNVPTIFLISILFCSALDTAKDQVVLIFVWCCDYVALLFTRHRSLHGNYMRWKLF